jgi:DNA-binding transcriptional LysR family regulator
LSNLNGTSLVAPAKSSTADKFMKELVHEGFRIKISMHCGTQDSVKTIVKRGVGVGILFKDFVMPECRKKVFKLINIQGLNLSLQSHIVYRKDRPLSQAAHEFLTLLRAKSQKRRDALSQAASIAV